MSVIAGATERIRLFPTCSTTFSRPYQLARELRSLDALSGGRAGWNAVWSLAGHDNFGLVREDAPATRLAAANAALAALHDLWSGFDADGLVADAATGEFARLERLRVGDAQLAAGVQGPLTLPGRGALPMMTAAGSPLMLDFAARWADSMFAATGNVAAARSLATDVSRRALEHGRAADVVGVHPGIIMSVRSGGAAPLPEADGAGARHFVAAGTPEEVAARVAEFLHDSDAPGFVALPFGGWESLELALEEVLPAFVPGSGPPPRDRPAAGRRAMGVGFGHVRGSLSRVLGADRNTYASAGASTNAGSGSVMSTRSAPKWASRSSPSR